MIDSEISQVPGFLVSANGRGTPDLVCFACLTDRIAALPTGASLTALVYAPIGEKTCRDCGLGVGWIEEEENDDPVCVCGVHASEHQLCGCPDGFQRAATKKESAS